MSNVANALSLAFEGGVPSQFAQDHLGRPDQPNPEPVPEPATLSLVGIGLTVLAARRFKGRGGASA